MGGSFRNASMALARVFIGIDRAGDGACDPVPGPNLVFVTCKHTVVRKKNKCYERIYTYYFEVVLRTKATLMMQTLIYPEDDIKGGRLVNGYYHIPIVCLPAGEAEARQHIESLTIQPQGNHDFGKTPPPVTAGCIENGELVVPRSYGLSAFGGVALPSVCTPRSDMAFHGELSVERHQFKAVDRVMCALRDPRRMGATLCLPCGFGKTVVALHISALMGGRTLVLCHKSCLMEQWQERIAQYLPGAKVGVIKGGRAEVSPENAVVVGMLQSVHSHSYPEGTLTGFTTLIVDEAHHVPAATFLEAVGKIGCDATLALTATPERRDGLTPLLYAAMGGIAFKVDRPPMDGVVRISTLQCSASVVERRIHGRNSAVNISRLITDIAGDSQRTQGLVNDIVSLLGDGMRHVIVLSDRTAQLKEIQRRLLSTGHPTLSECPHGGARLLIGSTKSKDRESALSARVVLTTYAFSQEGVDKPHLDTLVIASPKGDVVQAVGRILREHPTKATPLVLDYRDVIDSGILHGLFAKRQRIYREHGFTVEDQARR